MRLMVSTGQSPQNVRVAARSRLRAAPPDSEPSPDVWLPSSLKEVPESASEPVRVVEQAEAVPAEPAAAAELGAEVQRLRRELSGLEERVAKEADRADRAEREAGRLGERIEAMKRAAAQAAVAAHPSGDNASSDGELDLNAASFEQLRGLGLSVTQAARVIGQREQHGGFSSLDDVDGVMGIPKSVKQTLKQQGSV
jgi:DNA uptake protein ComE-like DNA-binding protein